MLRSSPAVTVLPERVQELHRGSVIDRYFKPFCGSGLVARWCARVACRLLGPACCGKLWLQQGTGRTLGCRWGLSFPEVQCQSLSSAEPGAKVVPSLWRNWNHTPGYLLWKSCWEPFKLRKLAPEQGWNNSAGCLSWILQGVCCTCSFCTACWPGMLNRCWVSPSLLCAGTSSAALVLSAHPLGLEREEPHCVSVWGVLQSWVVPFKKEK